jgi:hypothetical protein
MEWWKLLIVAAVAAFVVYAMCWFWPSDDD